MNKKKGSLEDVGMGAIPRNKGQFSNITIVSTEMSRESIILFSYPIHSLCSCDCLYKTLGCC